MASSGSKANSPALSSPPPMLHKSKIRFCPACGSPTKLAIPDGDEKMRLFVLLVEEFTMKTPKWDSVIVMHKERSVA
ncbi:nudix hydrolase 23, chloroplastic-like [Phragmites australis]|uniref:nudix hydrolase 23, chloroplastic-like n=1 Tax=Phragmites australis TaxID=29695 RepID=UPI002D76DAC7|nr:nudix hydrolase 23, chloroplastic-like [Phragmites australis]